MGGAGLIAVVALMGVPGEPELLLSTEVDFVATEGPHSGQTVTHGDELRADGVILRTWLELVTPFCPKPVFPNFGLDGLHRRADGTLLFTTDEGWFNECMSVQIRDGDLLHADGFVERTNEQLLGPFGLMPPAGNQGLDAVHELFSGEILFSIEQDVFSEALGVVLHHGDLLSDHGTVVKTYAQLLQSFCIMPIVPDLGLDAVFLPGSGEIWFSTEEGFLDECTGQTVGNGDLLSDAGYVVARNDQLLDGFILGNASPVGLDAAGTMGPVFFEGCGTLIQGVECVLFAADQGGVYLLDNLGPFNVGDRVWVSGILDLDCVTPCLEGDGCILANTIDPCFAGCGELLPGPQGCPILFPDDGSDFLFVENAAGAQFGESVFVAGRINPMSLICAPFTAPGIEDNTIDPCFAGCGELVQGAECVLFAADEGGTYLLNSLGPFTVGDDVWVSGGLDVGCFTICQEGDGCIRHNLIAACPADIDGSCAVDVDDLTQVILAWGPCPECPEDLDGNGQVDVDDLTQLILNWGDCP